MEPMNYSDNATANGPQENEEDDDVTEEVDSVTKIIIVAAYVIIFFFSFVGNSLVIHLVRTRINIRKNPFNWLLVNTAVADVVDVITASASALSSFLYGDHWISGILGTILCKLIPFLLVVSICASIWTLTVIAADRYLAIVCIRRQPLSHRSVVRSIVAVWLCAGLVFCGQLYKFKTELEDEIPVCYHEWHEDWEMSTLFYKVEMIVRVVVTYAVPLIIMAVLYSLIAFFLRRHRTPGHQSCNQRAFVRQARKRRAGIKMMVTAVTVFAICWLPVHISHIMSEFYSDAYKAIPKVLRWLFFWFAHANAAIHPWLFIVFSENLRVETKGIFRNMLIRKRGLSVQHPIRRTSSQQGFTTLETSRYLTPSRSSLDATILSFDTKL